MLEPEPENPKAPLKQNMDKGDELEFDPSQIGGRINTEGDANLSRSPKGSKQKQDKNDDLYAFEVETEEEINDLSTRKAIFALFWMSTMVLNIDTGVIPTAQLLMEDNLGITKGQIAFLAGISYLATGLASLFVSAVMKNYTAKSVLILAGFGNAISCFIFAYNDRYLWLVISRFVLGFFQAFYYSYAPVWINHFSPKRSTSTWISI